MQHLNIIQILSIYALPILFAVTVHEVAHGWMANRLGDPTAKMLGRLTLNPFKHIDLIGTIIVPAVMVTLGGIIFGWAKPVPVTERNLRGRHDLALVAAAGPMANFIMAFIWGAIATVGKLLYASMGATALPIIYMGMAGIMINIFLMVLNLLPLPPLDGSRVVSTYLPPKIAYNYNRLEPYGFFILLALLISGVLFVIVTPPVQFLQKLLFGIFI